MLAPVFVLSACLCALGHAAETALTDSADGISVVVTGFHVELAVATASSFRVSASRNPISGAIANPMIDTSSKPAAFTKTTNGPFVGIKTSFGAMEINPKTGEFHLLDPSGKNISTTPSLLTSTLSPARAAVGSNSTCDTTYPSTDAQNPQRTKKYPDGLKGATQSSCCAACDGDPECTFWVYALPSAPDPSGENCWLLKDVTATFKSTGRISGGHGPPVPIRTGFFLGTSSDAKFYGSGGGAGDSLLKQGSSPTVQNTRFQTPHYWSTDGYAAQGVSTWNNNGTGDYPASWTNSGDSVDWDISGDQADLYLMPAATAYEGLRAYWELTGAPKLPPKYGFGFLACRWGWVDRDYIQGILSSFRNGSYPLDAWISDFEWYTKAPDYNLPDQGSPTFADFDFNNVTFPAPQDQLDQYHNDFKVRFGGIRKPRLGNSALLTMAKDKGWLVGQPLPDGRLGSVNARDLNYSIGAVRDWYGEQHVSYLKTGVDFWWNDEGESSYFTFYFWNLAQYVGLGKFAAKRRFFTINRSYSPGMQRFGLVVWTGDIQSSWQSLQQQPRYLANWILAGVGFITCDTGGFGDLSNAPEPALLLTRWYQVALFLPTMRVHSPINTVPHFPFLWGEAAGDAMRKALNLRQQLVPMHYSLASAAYSTGRPWFRPLLFDFPEDSNVDDFTDQWMDGDSLMVAPVMNQDNSSNVYLPAGTWFEYNSTTTHAGPSSINTTGVALDHIPMYVKAGGILPHGPVKQYADAASTAPLVVQVYPGADGTFSLVEDDGATTDYTLGAQKTTVFTWTDSTKTLSWESSGSYAGSDVFTMVEATGFFPSGSKTSAAVALKGKGSISLAA